MKDPQKKVKNEECVLCGCDTGVAETVPVQDRKYYIYGCGNYVRTVIFH